MNKRELLLAKVGVNRFQAKCEVDNLLHRMGQYLYEIQCLHIRYDAALQKVYAALGRVDGGAHQQSHTAAVVGPQTAQYIPASVPLPANTVIDPVNLVGLVAGAQQRRARLNVERIKHWLIEIKRAAHRNDGAAYDRAIAGLRAEMPK